MSHRPILERLFGDLWSQGRLEIVDDLYDDDFRAHYFHPPKWGDGRDGVRQLVRGIRSAFPDYRETILDFLEAGERAAVRIRVTGTNTGTLGTHAPTGKSVAFEEIIIFRFSGGKAIEQWGVPDMLAFYSQLELAKVPTLW